MMTDISYINKSDVSPIVGAFDENQLIIRQSCFGSIPYGCKNSDYNGCGWIAAYNYLRLMGHCENWTTVNQKMNASDCTMLFGLLGTNPFKLVSFLKREGEPVKIRFLPQKAAYAAEAAGIGILMYWHGHGAHFTAFNKQNGEITVYNLNGKSVFRSFREFIVKVSRFPLVFLIFPEKIK